MGEGGDDIAEAFCTGRFYHCLPVSCSRSGRLDPRFPSDWCFPGSLSPPPPPRMASTAPDRDGWLLDRESEHFIYYTQPGQSIPDWAAELHEFTYAKVAELFPAARAPKIEYYRYPSQINLGRAFGHSWKGYATQTDEGSTVHSVQSCHPHEVIHAITFPIGRPPALFEEGV